MGEGYIYLDVRTLIYPRVTEPRDDDDATRVTARKRAFDTGEPPLPGYSSPAPRRTGWERDDE